MEILIVDFQCLSSKKLNVHAKKKHKIEEEEEERSVDPHFDEFFFIY